MRVAVCKRVVAVVALVVVSGVVALGGPVQAAEDRGLAQLGELLFSDPNLSKNRTQACATCHMPDNGFTDARDNGVGGMASLGDDERSVGGRNAPTAAYAAFSPVFHKTEKGVYKGGQFLDGRAKDLAAQAGGPPLNPIEMGMADKAAVVVRLQENPDYVTAFEAQFGADVFADADTAYAAMTRAIAAFEKTETFSPFTSKYDRYLRGEAKLTEQEELGRVLFFSQQFTNCNVCHQLSTSQIDTRETFSNYKYHNIGVPVNAALNAAAGKAPGAVDHGLLENPAVDDPAQDGKFKVPTLRNVAVSGPYMHNGVFADLRTVVKFYNSYNAKGPGAQINPESGQPWGAPEVAANISLKELKIGRALDDKRIDALVAFMKTLTDARYEHLLEP